MVPKSLIFLHFLTFLVRHTKMLNYELASQRVGTEECTGNAKSTINQLTVHHPRMVFQPHLPERTTAITKVLCWEHNCSQASCGSSVTRTFGLLLDHAQHYQILLMTWPWQICCQCQLQGSFPEPVYGNYGVITRQSPVDFLSRTWQNLSIWSWLGAHFRRNICCWRCRLMRSLTAKGASSCLIFQSSMTFSIHELQPSFLVSGSESGLVGPVLAGPLWTAKIKIKPNC